MTVVVSFCQNSKLHSKSFHSEQVNVSTEGMSYLWQQYVLKSAGCNLQPPVPVGAGGYPTGTGGGDLPAGDCGNRTMNSYYLYVINKYYFVLLPKTGLEM